MTSDERERHEDFDTSPWQCVECGGWNYPDDGEFALTASGPICGRCYGADAEIAEMVR
jgi:hypothetical protein